MSEAVRTARSSRRNHTIGAGEREHLDVAVAESVIRWASCTNLSTTHSLRASLDCEEFESARSRGKSTLHTWQGAEALRLESRIHRALHLHAAAVENADSKLESFLQWMQISTNTNPHNRSRLHFAGQQLRPQGQLVPPLRPPQRARVFSTATGPGASYATGGEVIY
ncbi:hypothetical protein EJB05_46593, partial [Eragrostis curvula]